MTANSDSAVPKRMVSPADAQHVADNLYNVLRFGFSLGHRLTPEAWEREDLRAQLENVHRDMATTIRVLCWACEERDIDSSPLAILATRWETLWSNFPQVRDAFVHFKEVMDEQEVIDLLARSCHRLLRRVEIETPGPAPVSPNAAVRLSSGLELGVEETDPGREVLVTRSAPDVFTQTARIRGASMVPLFLAVRDLSQGLKATERVTWSAVLREVARRRGWKGKVPTEATMRSYATRVRTILVEAGLGDLWQYTPETGVRFGSV